MKHEHNEPELTPEEQADLAAWLLEQEREYELSHGHEPDTQKGFWAWEDYE